MKNVFLDSKIIIPILANKIVYLGLPCNGINFKQYVKRRLKSSIVNPLDMLVLWTGDFCLLWTTRFRHQDSDI